MIFAATVVVSLFVILATYWLWGSGSHSKQVRASILYPPSLADLTNSLYSCLRSSAEKLKNQLGGRNLQRTSGLSGMQYSADYRTHERF